MLDADAEPADDFGGRASQLLIFLSQPSRLSKQVEDCRCVARRERPATDKVPQLLLETLQDTRRRFCHLYSQASCNMSNWDYWRGTFEAAQAQAQVAASQASKFAEVVSAQVRAHTDVSTHPSCSQQEVSRMLDQCGSSQSR